MKRTVLAALVLAPLAVLSFARPAGAADYTPPPFVCGPTQEPSQVPCDQVPSTTTTTVPFKYCLGYPQQFPRHEPCPRPPDTSCQGSARPLDCDPTYNPVAPVAQEPGVTVPPATAPVPTAVVSATSIVPDTATNAPRTSQRRTAPPRRRVVSMTTTTLPPLFFVLGHWLTYDEFVAYLNLMGA